MDRFSFLITPEYRTFLLGAFFILIAMGSIFVGRSPARGRFVYRANDPKTFWAIVAIDFAFGAYMWFQFMYRPALVR